MALMHWISNTFKWTETRSQTTNEIVRCFGEFVWVRHLWLYFPAEIWPNQILFYTKVFQWDQLNVTSNKWTKMNTPWSWNHTQTQPLAVRNDSSRRVCLAWCVTFQWEEEGKMASSNNPRKFSEKIALHNQKQAEETAAFEEVMKDLNITRAARVRRSHPRCLDLAAALLS